MQKWEFEFKVHKAMQYFSLKELRELIDQFPNLGHLKKAFEIKKLLLEEKVKNASK